MAGNEIKEVALVGGGVIGSGWATRCLANGLSVVITDPSPGAPAHLEQTIENAWSILEETGLAVKICRLIGVYSTPHRITEYADGNLMQGLSLLFEAERISGETCITDETTEVGYFSPEQMKSMDVMEPFYERVADALASQEAAFVR